MTTDEKTKLEAAGWQIIETGYWKSPLTGNAMPERAALAVFKIKPRGNVSLYRPRHLKCTPRAGSLL